MDKLRHVVGIDISTQSITAMLAAVREQDGVPVEFIISSAWTSARLYPDEAARKDPQAWVRMLRECIGDLRKLAAETELVEAIGVSTTFPGTFPIFADGRTNPHFVSLYDNTDGAGAEDEELEGLLAAAERETANRLWPGTMLVGLVHLVKSCGMDPLKMSALVPPNSAFIYGLLSAAGAPTVPGSVASDLSETVIGGFYDFRDFSTMPQAVSGLVERVLPGVPLEFLKSILPAAAPSWRNAVPEASMAAVQELLGLPNLRRVSVGGGDSPVGALALYPDSSTILNVRGSSDSPMMVIPKPIPRAEGRETALHYPLSTAVDAHDPWCVVAPILRSGKVWDWVRRLAFADGSEYDLELERLATAALKESLRDPERPRAVFKPTLGGERAPDWDSEATGVISGLVEAHGIGDIALAALEGMSAMLRDCLVIMETHYDAHPRNLLLAGGPVRNGLWNWITQLYTGKKTWYTVFADASLLGAGILGYGAAYDGLEDDRAISDRLQFLSEIAGRHPLINRKPVEPPDAELASLEDVYKRYVSRSNTDG